MQDLTGFTKVDTARLMDGFAGMDNDGQSWILLSCSEKSP